MPISSARTGQMGAPSSEQRSPPASHCAEQQGGAERRSSKQPVSASVAIYDALKEYHNEGARAINCVRLRARDAFGISYCSPRHFLAALTSLPTHVAARAGKRAYERM